MDIIILKELVNHLKIDGFNTKLSIDEWASIINFIKKRDEKLHVDEVLGKIEEFICGKQIVYGENKCDKQCSICLDEYANIK